MALGAALVDRARAIRNEPTGVKVAGTTQFATTRSAWFRCRLFLPPQPETQEPAGGRRRVENRPTLLYALKDADGYPIELTVETRVEIESREQGNAGLGVWQLDADPEPLRKRRRVIGWYVPLRKIEEHEFERVA